MIEDTQQSVLSALTRATIPFKTWPSNATVPTVVGQSVLSFPTNGAVLAVCNECSQFIFAQEFMRLHCLFVTKILKKCLPDETCCVLERPE